MKPRTVRSFLLAVGVLLLAAPCGALPLPPNVIGPGVNRMKTQAESTWEFRAEAGAFGQGSEPVWTEIATICDTLLGRSPSTPFDANNQAIIPVEIVALQLHSVAPVTVEFDGGQSEKLYDVAVTLSPTAPSTGALLVTRDPGGGGPDRGLIEGVPESFFDVLFDFTFTPRDPGDGGPGHFLLDERLTLTTDVPWDSVASLPYFEPMAGPFYPGLGQTAGVTMLGDPNVPQTLVFQGETFTWHLRLEPVPEPATLALFPLGGLAARRRRR